MQVLSSTKRGPGRPKIIRTDDERKAMQRERVKRYRDENLDKMRAYATDWAREKAAKRATKLGRKAGQKGPTPKILTPEQKRAKQNARVKSYYARNLEKQRVAGAVVARNRRARIVNAGGTHTAADIAWLHEKQKGKCVFCLLSFGAEKPHVDHYIPLKLGGSNDRSNLRLLHETCNLMKSAKHPVEFALNHGMLAW